MEEYINLVINTICFEKRIVSNYIFTDWKTLSSQPRKDLFKREPENRIGYPFLNLDSVDYLKSL